MHPGKSIPPAIGVHIRLDHYTKAYVTALVERYGDRVTVYPQNYDPAAD